MQTDYSSLTYDQLAEACAKLQSEIAAKEAELKAAKKILFSHMENGNYDEVVTFFGRYYKAKLPIVKVYPGYISDIATSLEEAKARAEANGEVEYGEQKYTYKFGKVNA